jgi:predicted metal-dependent hydrolase
VTRAFTLVYGDARIPYEVKVDTNRSTRVAIHVNPDGSVSVDAPPDFQEDAIKIAVQKRARWITTHVNEAVQRFAHVHPCEYVSGEQVLYLGRRYMLKVVSSEMPRKTAKLRGNRLEVESRTGNPEDIRGRVRAWYRMRAHDYMSYRLKDLTARLAWVETVPSFRLLEMSRQWGSCSPGGQLILNPHLVKTPRACIDYVLIHELAHLKHHNHGAEFFQLLEAEMADWRQHKQTLDSMVEVVMND